METNAQSSIQSYVFEACHDTSSIIRRLSRKTLSMIACSISSERECRELLHLINDEHSSLNTDHIIVKATFTSCQSFTYFGRLLLLKLNSRKHPRWERIRKLATEFGFAHRRKLLLLGKRRICASMEMDEFQIDVMWRGVKVNASMCAWRALSNSWRVAKNVVALKSKQSASAFDVCMRDALASLRSLRTDKAVGVAAEVLLRLALHALPCCIE